MAIYSYDVGEPPCITQKCASFDNCKKLRLACSSFATYISTNDNTRPPNVSTCAIYIRMHEHGARLLSL